MAIDWTAVGTIVSLMAVVFAIVTLSIETRQSRIALQTDALLRLAEQFDSDRMRKLRRIGANGMLKQAPGYEDVCTLDEILEFFGEIAFLRKQNALDDDLVFNQFSGWAIRYWLCSTERVRQVRIQDPLGWVTLEKFVKALHARERKEGYPEDSYSADIGKNAIPQKSL